jgi:hypothetical protein
MKERSLDRKRGRGPVRGVRRPLFVLLALCACQHQTPGDRDGAAPEETPPPDAAAPVDRPPAKDATVTPVPPDAAGSETTAPSPDAAPTPDLPPGEVTVAKTVALDGAKLAEIKRRLGAGDAQLAATLATLRAAADAALTAGPWSVMNKTATPPSGNKHDYLSLARYYWPSASANGCPYVHKDGQTNPETTGNKYDHASRHAAVEAIYDLALTWYFTGDARYAQRAGLVARTWFLDDATRMNPNVNFGEGVPCLRDGTDTGVLNWTEMMQPLLDGLAVLDSGAPGWTAADQMGMRTWLTAFLGWMQTAALAKEEGRATNNHGTWYDAGVAALMVYLGQPAQAKALIQGSSLKRLGSQIKADGSQPEELSRTNSWGYSNWNLEGFCLLADLGRPLGVDLWTYVAPGGGSLVKATDYLIDGAVKGKSAWTHPQMLELEPTWAVPLFHAAADLGNDASARGALAQVSAPGDLWSLLPVCTAPAIQPN